MRPLSARCVHGTPLMATNGELGCVSTDNGTGSATGIFRGMMADLNIARELKAVERAHE